jgi:hypothetical protein
MDYRIGHTDDEVTIDLSGTAGRNPQVLKALRECQEGRCGCPTNQYEQLADIACYLTSELCDQGFCRFARRVACVSTASA